MQRSLLDVKWTPLTACRLGTWGAPICSGCTGQHPASLAFLETQLWNTSPKHPGQSCHLLTLPPITHYLQLRLQRLQYGPEANWSDQLITCVLNYIYEWVLCRWVVPLIWVPIILACLRRSFLDSQMQWPQLALLVAAGVLLWQLLEYCIHRWGTDLLLAT